MLPRAPREVPGASRRPLRSGPRRFQRHLSNARDLRSTSEAALKAFRAHMWSKLRAPHLFSMFFLAPGRCFLATCGQCSVASVRLCFGSARHNFLCLSLLRRCSCCFCSECQRCLSLSLQRKCKPTCKRRSHEATWGQIHKLSD